MNNCKLNVVSSLWSASVAVSLRGDETDTGSVWSNTNESDHVVINVNESSSVGEEVDEDNVRVVMSQTGCSRFSSHLTLTANENNAVQANVLNFSEDEYMTLAEECRLDDMKTAAAKFPTHGLENLRKIVDDGEYNLLHLAVSATNDVSDIDVSNMVQFLIEKGVDVNQRSSNGTTVAMIASTNGRLQLIKKLVQNHQHILKSADGGDVCDDGGSNMLHWAFNASPDVVDDDRLKEIGDYLIHNGVDIMHKSNQGQMPCQCRRGSSYQQTRVRIGQINEVLSASRQVRSSDSSGLGYEMSDLLVCNQNTNLLSSVLPSRDYRTFGDCQSVNSDGPYLDKWTHNIASNKIESASARSLVSSSQPSQMLTTSDFTRDYESTGDIAQEMDEFGQPLASNDTQMEDWELLIIACETNNVAEVEVFLENDDLEVNRTGTDGNTALYAACQHGFPDIVRLLLGHPEVDVLKTDQTRKFKFTPLTIACLEGHIDVIQVFIDHPHTDVNQTGLYQNEQAPFWTACCFGHTQVVELLLQNPQINVNQPEKNEQTPFWAACCNCHTQVVELLVQNPQINVNRPDKNEQTPFWTACCNGHTQVVQLFLQNQQINVNQPEKNEKTPFWAACTNCHTPVVELLLQNPQVNVNQPDKNEQTPFWTACCNGHTQVVELLVQNPQINVNQPDKDEQTPFWTACCNCHTQVVQLLLQNPQINVNQPEKNEKTPFWAACSNCHTPVVELLLQNPQVNVNRPDKNEQTPFWTACCNGHTQVVELLVQNPQINVNQPDKDEKTPFWAACSNCHTPVVELLLQNPQVNVNRPDKNEQTPFWTACCNGHTQVVELLVQNPQINVNQPNNDECTPFAPACHYGHTQVVELLLQHPQINVNKPDKNGCAPFYGLRHLQVVELLLQYPEINVNQRNMDGQTPFWSACWNGRTQVVELFLQHPQTNVNQSDDYVRTPFWSACYNGHAQVVELLLQHPQINVNQPDQYENTPLWEVCCKSHTQLVRLLLRHPQINVNQPANPSGMTALFGLYFTQHFFDEELTNDNDVQQILLTHGASYIPTFNLPVWCYYVPIVVFYLSACLLLLPFSWFIIVSSSILYLGHVWTDWNLAITQGDAPLWFFFYLSLTNLVLIFPFLIPIGIVVILFGLTYWKRIHRCFRSFSSNCSRAPVWFQELDPDIFVGATILILTIIGNIIFLVAHPAYGIILFVCGYLAHRALQNSLTKDDLRQDFTNMRWFCCQVPSRIIRWFFFCGTDESDDGRPPSPVV